MHQLIQNFGVIGTVAVLAIGGYIAMKIFENNFMWFLLIIALILYMNNSDFLSNMTLPNDLGTVQSLNTAHTNNEQQYQQCLMNSITPEWQTNYRLRQAWDSCNTEYTQQLNSCIQTANKDSLILDKQVYCTDKIMSAFWEPCAENSIRTCSNLGDVPVQKCQNQFNIANLRGTAGVLGNVHIFQKVHDWIDAAWNTAQGWAPSSGK